MSQEQIMEKIRELARELSPDNLDLAITDLQMIQEAAQQSVQPTCSTCGAKLRSGDIWWNECEKCHSKIASG